MRYIMKTVRTHSSPIRSGRGSPPRESASWRTKMRPRPTTDNFKFSFGGIKSKNSRSEYLKYKILWKQFQFYKKVEPQAELNSAKGSG